MNYFVVMVACYYLKFLQLLRMNSHAFSTLCSTCLLFEPILKLCFLFHYLRYGLWESLTGKREPGSPRFLLKAFDRSIELVPRTETEKTRVQIVQLGTFHLCEPKKHHIVRTRLKIIICKSRITRPNPFV